VLYLAALDLAEKRGLLTREQVLRALPKWKSARPYAEGARP
jgi:hypothetical protein